MMLRKWTNGRPFVHQVREINGQSEMAEVVEFSRKSTCPFLENSRGAGEGTLPGKAA